jgi:hypothetical protein
MLLRRFHISCAKDATCGATAYDAHEFKEDFEQVRVAMAKFALKST